MRPDRVVIGAETDRAREVLRQLYRPLYLIEAPIVFTGIETAELTKYAANAFLAMKVTFINEMADLCEKVGADVHDVARGIGLDGRIGRKFLHPGPGYRRLLLPQGHAGAGAHRAGRTARRRRLVETTVAVNDARKSGMAMRVITACGGSVRGKTIARARPDLQAGDRRHARLARRCPSSRAWSATARRSAPSTPRAWSRRAPLLPGSRRLLPRRAGCRGRRRCAGGDHRMERVPRPVARSGCATAMRGRVLVDLRNVYDPIAMRQAGFDYHGIGRPLIPTLA